MLTNYDAKGVAELLGLAFHRQMSGRRVSGPGAARGEHMTGIADMVIVSLSVRGRGGRDPVGSTDPPSPPTSALIEEAVEKGLPWATLRHVAEWLAGGDKAKVSTLEQSVVPKTTLERRDTRLSPQDSERTERIARLSVHARRALGTAPEAREFMTTPHPGLDGRSPVEAARTDLGARRVEQLLNALEYGLAL